MTCMTDRSLWDFCWSNACPSVYITYDTFFLWVAVLFSLKLACTNIPFNCAAIFDKTIPLSMDIFLWIYKWNHAWHSSRVKLHREKDRFAKYDGMFILAHDNFNLMLSALHTGTFLLCHSRRLYKLVTDDPKLFNCYILSLIRKILKHLTFYRIQIWIQKIIFKDKMKNRHPPPPPKKKNHT